MQEMKENAKFFKAGNSFGLRLTKRDKELMHAEPGDEYEKTISPDGKTVTFKKKEKVDSQTMAMIDQLFDENKELMGRLKDE
jgi:ABC-type oligopeptide transport system substrate-binding subunit